MSSDKIEQEQFQFNIQPQPDDSTCGPTCLHAVYRFFGDEIPLSQVIAETTALEEGGTLAVLLGCHAIKRGYQATVYTFNLRLFDPTWFDEITDSPPGRSSSLTKRDLISKLKSQVKIKESPKLQAASQAYCDFLQLGGRLRMQDLNATLLRRFLKRSVPILTGLSATYLYHCIRELPDGTGDDIAGYPTGHFVVLAGYDKPQKLVRVADPYLPNPLGEEHHYAVELDRLICAIMLGVLTYDANLLIIEPARNQQQTAAVRRNKA